MLPDTSGLVQVRVFKLTQGPGLLIPKAEVTHTATLTPDRRAEIIERSSRSRRLAFAIGPTIKSFTSLGEDPTTNAWVQLNEII